MNCNFCRAQLVIGETFIKSDIGNFCDRACFMHDASITLHATFGKLTTNFILNEANKEPEEEQCETCGGKIVGRCRCMVGHKICENGHGGH